MLKNSCLTILLFFLGSFAQVDNLSFAQDLSKEVFVSSGTLGKQLIEPHLATHPTDPNILLGVAWVYPKKIQNRQIDKEYCMVFLSTDGGITWVKQKISTKGCADPWVSLTQDTAILTLLGSHQSLPDQDSGSQLISFFSQDDGKSWLQIPQSLGRGHDGPRSITSTNGEIYIVSGKNLSGPEGRIQWNIFAGMKEKNAPYIRTLNYILPTNLAQIPDGAVVLSDGVFVVSYQDYQRPVGGPKQAFRGRHGALETRRQWAIFSIDNGKNFSYPRLISESCYSRPTFIAVDKSEGEFKDRIYHVCSGEQLKSILLTYSSDGGDEWSETKAIESPASNSRSRWIPQVAVNNEGVVAVAWMDRRDDASGKCYAPYISLSIDGGASFRKPIRLSDKISCPNLQKSGIASSRWPVGGDYFGLAAAADGTFHLLWPDARNGTFELWTSSVKMERK